MLQTPRGILKFVELEAPDGSPPRSLSVEIAPPVPLSFDQLKAAKPTVPLTVKLDWKGAKIVETDIPGADVTKLCSIGATVESPFSAYAIGLVRGGWLPPSLLGRDAIVMLDRNAITEIVSRFEAGALKGRSPDFIDLFQSGHVRLNPMLAVLEGAEQRLPSAEEAEAQMQLVTRKLKAALPDAEVMTGPAHLQGARGLIEESRPWFKRHQAFLMKIAPQFAGPIGQRRRARVWADVLVAADHCGVSRTSIVLLAVLSALADRGNGPGRGVLKFKEVYAAGDAYNAVADLRAIELYFHMFAFHPAQPVQLCTADRALALFWVGIGAHTFRQTPAGLEVDFSFHPEILPEWAGEWWRDASKT